MTKPGTRQQTGSAAGPGTVAARWRPAVPELIMVAVAVAVAALFAAAVSGWPGVVTVAAVVTVLALLVLRSLIPRSAAQGFRRAQDKQRARAISGYSQRRFVVSASVATRAMYESDLRPILEHILAARLADAHGVNLYTEPVKAKQTFCRNRGDESLWPWIDPGQTLSTDERSRPSSGISRRTLARLIARLEQL